MAIPDFQEIMLPLLRSISDKKIYTMKDVISRVAIYFNLTDEEKETRYPSGSDKIFNNRVRFSKLYLLKAGLIQSPSYGKIQLTSTGIEVLGLDIKEIDVAFLMRFKEFNNFLEHDISHHKQKDPLKSISTLSSITTTPEEQIDKAFTTITENLSSELLEIIKKQSPAFFENLVIDLILNMGYGGSRTDAGAAIGKSGDGGIDGIIKEDKLGLDIIYIQAKRWENNVPTSEIHKFAGALQAKRAKKGIFITTSSFPNGAYEFVDSIDSKIILIDGELLAKYMIEYNVGVNIHRSIEIKRIDFDYFSEE